MQTKEQKVQTAFILSIIGYSVGDIFLIGLLFYYRITAFISATAYLTFFFYISLIATLVAPIVLGSVALTMIKDARGVKGKYRVFYIISRILSILAIIEGAILSTGVIVYFFLVVLVLLLI